MSVERLQVRICTRESLHPAYNLSHAALPKSVQRDGLRYRAISWKGMHAWPTRPKTARNLTHPWLLDTRHSLQLSPSNSSELSEHADHDLVMSGEIPRSTECLPISTRMWSQSCMYASPSLVLMDTAWPPSHFNGTNILWGLGHFCTRSRKPFMVWTHPVAITSCPHCSVSSLAEDQRLATWWRSPPDPTTESDHDPLYTIGSGMLPRQAFLHSRPRLC